MAPQNPWGLVRGVVRTETGEPATDCSVGPYPAGGTEDVPDMDSGTTADGRYELDLPPGTYTIKANCHGCSGAQLYGEATDVRVAGGRTVTADIVVGEGRSG